MQGLEPFGEKIKKSGGNVYQVNIQPGREVVEGGEVSQKVNESESQKSNRAVGRCSKSNASALLAERRWYAARTAQRTILYQVPPTLSACRSCSRGAMLRAPVLACTRTSISAGKEFGKSDLKATESHFSLQAR